MKVGHLYLANLSGQSAASFIALVESLDRLAISQCIVVCDNAVARRLQSCPYVDVSPVVRSPVLANCVMPSVDIVHAHDDKSGQAGLLLALTRSVPYVLSQHPDRVGRNNVLMKSVRSRATVTISPGSLTTEQLVEVYRRAASGRSKLVEHTNGR